MTQSEIIDKNIYTLIDRFNNTHWNVILRPIFEDNRFRETLEALYEYRKEGIKFTPDLKNVFRIFSLLQPADIKVVILGMDPYPKEGVANGIAFCGANCDKPPVSLRYIFDEIQRTVYPHEERKHDINLERWVKQGVLLLNAYLTCQIGKPGSHSKLWSWFTEELIKNLDIYYSGFVFVFLGAESQKFAKHCNGSLNHKFLVSHPASASYAKGGVWNSNNLFNKINDKLKEQEGKIEW
jgi:uracil-DNA glycosylase